MGSSDDSSNTILDLMCDKYFFSVIKTPYHTFMSVQTNQKKNKAALSIPQWNVK